jgi:signal transduction histidine kinase
LVHVDLVQIGGHRYILSTTQDITDRKRAEAERDRLLAAEREARTLAEEFLRLRDEFLSIASHELRTPLTTLSAHVQLLLRQYRRDRGMDPEQLERGLRSIAAESSKLARLIEQLLDISRIQTGRLELARQLTDVHELVESAAAGARARTGRDPITLGAARPVRARVDPLRIEQVLTNLLENAVKYSPAGGGVEFAVRDHGDGIPPRWWQPLHRPAAHRWSGQRSAWNYHPGDKAVAACSWSSTTRISARSSYLSLVLASFLLGCQAWPGN